MLLVVKNLPANAEDARDSGFSPWVVKIPLEKGMATCSSILAGESHGQRSLVGYMGSQESDTTEHTQAHYSTARSEDMRTEEPQN